jgi:hypothetical protein
MELYLYWLAKQSSTFAPAQVAIAQSIRKAVKELQQLKSSPATS